MDYNYHTHTYRCGHAVGDDEEYVLRAIEGGIKHMGFSDHAPYAFPDGYEQDYRVQMSAVEGYFESLNGLREKYRDKIDIKIGFELEYYPTHFDDMLKLVRNLGAEYIILGQHHVGDGYPECIPSSKSTDSEDNIRSYVDSVTSAIKSGFFSYVAHPDIINFVGNGSIYREEMTRLCSCSLDNNIPIEINFLGIRTGRFYPNPRFWEIASEVGCPVTFGCDAHAPKDAFDPESLATAKWLVRRYKLNYIGMPKIISIS